MPSCQHCGIATTALPCPGCLEGLRASGKPSQVNYCSEKCLEADKDLHAAECSLRNDRLQVFRACKLIQDAFYESRRRHFHKDIATVVKTGDVLTTTERTYADNGPIYFEFPDDLFPEERDKKAMLAWLSCDDSVVHMLDLTKAALEGIPSKLREVRVDIHLKTARFSSGGFDGFGVAQTHAAYQHVLIQVELRDNVLYALDITAAQYGLMNPVSTWKSYSDLLVSKVVSTTDLGISKRIFDCQIQGAFPNINELNLAVVREIRQMHKDFDGSLGEWCKKTSAPLGQTLRGKEETSEKYCRELLDFLQRDMMAKVAGRGQDVKPRSRR